MPENRLALEVSLETGLRIGDVLALRIEDLAPRFTITEAKTRKRRTVKLKADTLRRLRSLAGGRPKGFVFVHRKDPERHRTRQAVYSDLKRAAKAFRIPTAVHCTPHTARKIAAVDLYHRTGDLKRVQQLLNHSGEGVTLLYALADVQTQRRLGQRGGRYRVPR